MLTEDEAREKWCPATRVTGAGTATGQEWHTNRPSHAEVDQKNFDRCLGSACMAWRWLREIDPDSPPDMLTYRDTDRGFCGLGGHPQ